MSTFGRYWAEPIQLGEAVTHQGQGMLFTACRNVTSPKHKEYYTEFDDLSDMEVRFLAAMIMAVDFDDGVVSPYPVSESFACQYDGDLSDPDFLHATAITLRGEVAAMHRLATAPPIITSSRNMFEYHHGKLNFHHLKNIFSALKSADDLLLRGLQALIKCQMIATHAEFVEEANYALYVSLDALFSTVRRRLIRTGNTNPSAYDAQAYVHNMFNETQSGMRFFEEFYIDRIMTMHPENKYGIFRHAPISHSDFHYLFKMARTVYREVALRK